MFDISLYICSINTNKDNKSILISNINLKAMQTASKNIAIPTYTMSFKAYKVGGVKMRQVKVYQNGKWVYKDEFKAEEREKREQFARNFLNAMKLHDSRQIMAQLEQAKGI